MRITILITLLVLATVSKAQPFLASGSMNNSYSGMFAHNFQLNDSSLQKKWFVTRQSALITSYSFFKGGGATVVAAPLGLQLNRRLSNNLYAFANAAITPAYVSFNRSFMAANFNKGLQNNNTFKQGTLGVYSSASLGLLYVNDEKTFSLSGSITVEKSSYPTLPYYRTGGQRVAPGTAVNQYGF